MEIAIALGLFACGIWGFQIGAEHERENTGLWLGLCFGPLGVAIAAMLDYRVKCERCREGIHSRASVCPHCGLQFAVGQPAAAQRAPAALSVKPPLPPKRPPRP